MNLPTTQPFSSIPNGGVFSPNMKIFGLKSDATTWVDLSSGAITTGTDPNAQNYYFAGATLVLG